jgi:sulfite exporter TauE/SafE
MCGPMIGIACSVKPRDAGAWSWLRRALAYNAGRVSSYVAAGVMTGALGGAGLALRGVPHVQQAMLLAMSLSMLLLAAYLAGIAPFVSAVERFGAVAWRRLSPFTRRFLPIDTDGRAFGMGLVFGWLPCGMVYVALIAALTTANALHGGLVMAAFGLGTLPNVLAISAWFRWLPAFFKNRAVRIVAAAAIAAFGAWGVLHAVHPSPMTGGASWCLQIPGLGAWGEGPI